MDLMAVLGRLKLEQQKLESIAPGQPIVLWSEEFQNDIGRFKHCPNLYHSRTSIGSGEPAICSCIMWSLIWCPTLPVLAMFEN